MTSRDAAAAAEDWWRFYRTVCFVRYAAFKALALGFVVVSVVSEYWLAPRAPASSVPGLARAGLWRAEYHVGGFDDDGTACGLPRSSVSRFWCELEGSFRRLGERAGREGREGRPGRVYANVFGRSHAVRFRLAQATAFAFTFALTLEWIVLVFYFVRRRGRRDGFATASSTAYSGIGAAMATCACVSYASIVAYVRADTPTHVPGLRKAAFTAYLGWGYWMFLTCACAHVATFGFSAFDWDRASKARARRRRRHSRETRDSVRGGTTALAS